MTKKFITHTESFISSLQKKFDDSNGNINRNLIHLTQEEIDLPIYRIFPFHRLQEIFTNKELVFIKPKKWDDPFENWLLKSKFKLKNGEEISILSSQDFVGQCWSLTEENDAMWRIYSSKKGGVKIKTTIRKLLITLLTGVQDDLQHEISKFIGKVKYLTKEEIIKEFQNNYKSYLTTNIGQAKSHFYKRPEFKHEDEIRILFKTSKNIEDNKFKLKIDPYELIDEIILDPRLKDTRTINKKKGIN